MSSSRRRSQAEVEGRGPCPTCGGVRVVPAVEEVVLTVRGVKRRFPDVPHDKCLSCGERIFGIEASQRFDAALRSRRRTRAA